MFKQQRMKGASVRLVIFLTFIGVCQALISGPPTHLKKQPPKQLGEHLFRLNDHLYSGDSPMTLADFQALRQLGVTCMISVDGAVPDRELAAQVGIEYKHWPVLYSGFSKETAWGIAHWVKSQPGTVYLHCHHGKHRGPAAAACVMLALDPTFTRQDAEEWLTLAGTDPRYVGLIRMPWTMPRPTASQWETSRKTKPVIATDGLVPAMVAIDERFDLLKQDSATAHDAVILGELFREAARLPRVDAEEYAEPEALARQLEEALRSQSWPNVERLRVRLSTQCTDCHARHRD